MPFESAGLTDARRVDPLEFVSLLLLLVLTVRKREKCNEDNFLNQTTTVARATVFYCVLCERQEKRVLPYWCYDTATQTKTEDEQLILLGVGDALKFWLELFNLFLEAYNQIAYYCGKFL